MRSTCDARGLGDYYTGVVYETVLDAYPQIGSICSGGRYDDLAGHYTRSKLPGVGISIGLTWLFYQLRKTGLVASAGSSVDVLVALLDDAASNAALFSMSQRLRRPANETQLEPRKLAKQLRYADKGLDPFVAMRAAATMPRAAWSWVKDPPQPTVRSGRSGNSIGDALLEAKGEHELETDPP